MTVVDSELYENDAVAYNRLSTTTAELANVEAKLRDAEAELDEAKII